MNDRFKFRAKRLDNNKFVYGYLCFIYVDNEKHCKIYSPDEVMSYDCYTETLGQCTGLKDKNDKLIYEGDIILIEDNKCPIEWESVNARYNVVGYGEIAYLNYNDIEVIGNIHENADLLEVNND